MDILTTSIGALIIAFGVYTMIARFKSPDKFAKLEAMKEKFGSGVGTTIHTIAYSVVPIVFGGIVIFAGIGGVSLTQMFSS